LNDSQSANLSGKSSKINYFYKPPTLDSNHPNDDKYIFVCHDEFPSTSYDISVPHEYFDLDLESTSIKEDVHIKNSPSPHYPLCPTIRNTSTYNEDTPSSFLSSSDVLSPRLTQGAEVVHDEI